MTYRKHNEEWIAKLAKEGGHRCEPYKINTDEVFDLFPPAVLKRVQEPANDWANKQLGWTTKQTESSVTKEEQKRLL